MVSVSHCGGARSESPGVYGMLVPCGDGNSRLHLRRWGGGVCGVVDTCTEALLTQAPPRAL